MGGDGAAGAPLGASDLPVLLRRVHAALAAQRERIDALNVFPVPDGDTGTNMVLTVRAGLEALDALDRTDAGDPATAARAVIRGALRGARGNSGVILSQVIRAVVDVVAGHDRIDAARFASALDHARVLAYEAVAQPVEGTILTVIAVAAEEADAAVEDGHDLVGTSARVCDAVRAAVTATRDQLDVLRDAGVVDAGARGFEVMMAAVHGHLTGEDHQAAADHPDLPGGPFRDEGCDGSLAYRYEVQYLLAAEDAAAEPLRRRLEVLGDSVVVVSAGGLLNVHVHTDDIGGAIEEGIAVGRPSDIEVTHFADQIAALRSDDPPTSVGAVAVVSGSGAVALARSLGAIPVEGASGQLPSVADLLNACGSVRARTVVLLPGHPNAVPTARQASDVAVAEGGRALAVVDAATSLPAVLSALAVFDPAADPDAVLAACTDAAAAVRCGEVVDAVRDADTPVGRVRVGQPLAVADGEVVAACTDRLAALEVVARHLEVGGAELVTLLLGAEVTSRERRSAERLLEELAGPATEVEVVVAGQRPAAFALGVE